MTPTTIIADLQAIGVTLTAHGDKLRVNGPTGTVTAEWRATLATHKDALLTALRAPSVAEDDERVSVDDAPAPLPPTVSDFWRERPPFTCPVCGGYRQRLWSSDGGHTWDEHCCACEPLIIRNPDGSLWSNGAIIRSATAETPGGGT